MIELKFTGMCEGCKHASLKLEYEDYSAMFEVSKVWHARCIHAEACDDIKNRTIEILREEDDNTI